MSSTAEEFTGGGGFLYHVPQHSRREKLRFPADETATSSVGLLYQSNGGGGGGFHELPSYNNQNMEECGPQQIPAAQGFSLSLSPATVGPLGPFTGYAAVLNRSGFVEPARQLLEEICRQLVGRGGGGGGELGGRDLMVEDIMTMDHITMDTTLRPPLQEEHHWKKLKLVSMLDQVYRRYRLYYQQVEAVITSFETVAGLNTAAPYVSLALKSMSKNFKSLKNLISNHLSNLDKVNGKEGLLGKGEFTGFSLTATGDHTCSQRRNSSFTFGQPQVWRPQRGLPERAVAVLRAWLFEHFLHPYPTDTDKQMLAKQTGLTRNQVSNWFINARVRLWKPMVEEIHNLELHQKLEQETLMTTTHNVKSSSNTTTFQPSSSSAATSSRSSNRPPPVENNINFMMAQRNKLEQQQHHHHRSNTTSTNYPPRASSNIIEEQLLLPHHDHHINIEEEVPYKFVFDDDHFASHHPAVGGSVVSLTLGLPPDQPLMSAAMNLNVARRFGLEECSNAAAAAYVLAGFEGGQDRHHHYGAKDIIGAHLLRDFVG